jgi:serine/threonine protein kinase
MPALLVSELPWDQPSSGCAEYLSWKENKYTSMTPWSKLDTLTLALLRKILNHSPANRLTLDKILSHKWCNLQFHDSGKRLNSWLLLPFLFFFHNFFLFTFLCTSEESQKKTKNDYPQGYSYFNQVLSDSQRFFQKLEGNFVPRMNCDILSTQRKKNKINV